MTLMETLVVLAVIGIASAAATAGLLSRPADTLGAEARRLADAVALAADTALATQATLALAWSERGYGLRRLAADGRWERAGPALPPPDRDLPPGFALRRADGLTAPVRLSPDGLAPAVVLELTDGRGLRRVRFDGLAVDRDLRGAP